MVNGGRRYEIETPLGKGGFGTVYRARFVGEGGFSKVVALKVLNENMVDLQEVLARLRDEARLLGMLRHRAIVRADRLVRLANRWAVVMEYVEGADLKRIVSATNVPPGVAVEIVGEVAGALHSAWNAPGPDGPPLRLIHRDIKPSNIVLTAYGEIKVLDFGIARADFGGREAETKAFGMGSLPYMAPERLDFRDTAAADVYALGVVFFELVTGRAFGRASAVPERHTKHVDAALRFLVEQGHGSRDLLLFLGSLLAYDPDDRPSARQLERMCVNLRRRFEDEPLRYWAEKVVPDILVNIAQIPADGLTGSSLVEQAEGSFGSLAGDGPTSSSGAFRRPVGAVSTGSSASFRRPVGVIDTVSTGSGTGSDAFRRPAGRADSGSVATSSRSVPPPPAPPLVLPPRSAVGAEKSPPVVSGPLLSDPSTTVERATDPGPSGLPDKPSPRYRWVVVAVLMFVLVLAAGVFVGIGVMKQIGVPQVAPTTPADVSGAVSADPPPAAPAEPPAADAEDPSPAATSPAPSETTSTPKEASEPKVPRARVEVAGDAEKVVLVGSAGAFSLPGWVPEGSYTIRATFAGREAMVAGRAAVHGGASLTVRCSSGFTRCKAE